VPSRSRRPAPKNPKKKTGRGLIPEEHYPLFTAVFRNDVERLGVLLQAGGEVNARDRDGRTLLMHAAIDGREAIARVLVERGADVDARDRGLGWTALHFAAQDHHVAVARILLSQGAEVDPQDVHGNTPLSNAVFEARGRDEMVALLLAHGADRHQPNQYGVSPVGLARSIGNFPVPKSLDS
jgi:ankyrin repeat protein